MKINQPPSAGKGNLGGIDPELMRLAAVYAKERPQQPALRGRTGSFLPEGLPRLDRETYLRVFHGSGLPVKLPAEPPTREITPKEALGAALLAVAGTYDKLEDYQVFAILSTVDIALLDASFLQYERYPLEDLFKRIGAVVDQRQKLSILANVIDFAMLDGYYRSNERRLIRLFRNMLSIEDKDYENIFQVLMFKHDLGVFD